MRGVFCMSFPLLQIIWQGECERVPWRWKTDGNVTFNASLPNKFKHAYFGEHVDALKPVDQAFVPQCGPMVNHIPCSFPNEDWRKLVHRPHHLHLSIVLLFQSWNRHAHVVRYRCQVLIAPDIGVNRADPVHAAENGFQQVNNCLRVFRGDVVLALKLWLHKATTVYVSCKVRLGPAKQRLWWNNAREARILFESTPRKRMVVDQLLGTSWKPPRTLVSGVLPLPVVQESILQVK
mmetsp:Transcript_124280/g.247721  ORF Transcript_124280/g.247721 Transcript_124280/m.247721 type:complete len:235 (+) Transcript_124280:910-1614(+)